MEEAIDGSPLGRGAEGSGARGSARHGGGEGSGHRPKRRLVAVATLLLASALLARSGPPPASLLGAALAAPAALRPVRVLVAGDSTAGAIGGGMRTWAQETGRAEVDIVGDGGCALQQEGLAVLRAGWTQAASYGCRIFVDYTLRTATASSPDLILLFLGSAQLSDWLLPGQQDPTAIGQPDFDRLYVNAATSALRTLAGVGIPILVTTTAVPSWNPTIQTGNQNIRGTGPILMNDAGRTRRLNELTSEVVRGQPLAELVPYAERIGGADHPVDSAVRPDGLHVTQSLVPGIMAAGLEADIEAAYQRVTARVGSSARAGFHVWSRRSSSGR